MCFIYKGIREADNNGCLPFRYLLRMINNRLYISLIYGKKYIFITLRNLL